MAQKKKRQTLENILVTGLGYGGIGIGALPNGKKVLVKGGLPGSVVDGRVLKQKKDYIELQITNIQKYDTSLLQTEKICPHYLFPYGQQQDALLHKRGCGGCKRQAIAYTKQLELKHLMVTDSLRKVSACQQLSLPAVLPSPDVLHYRNKIEFSCGSFRVYHDESGKSDEPNGLFDEYQTVGFHQQGRFAQIVDIDQCFLISPSMHELFQYLKTAIITSELPMYHVNQHTGLWRHMVIRSGSRSGQAMVVLTYASRRFVDHEEDKIKFDALLQQRQEDSRLRNQLTTLVLVENNGLADIVHHPEVVVHTVRGEGRIFEELHIHDQILHFQISPFSFFQTNTLGAELLFTTALEMVGRVKGTILDLYCGSGTIGICALKSGRGSQLVGIEIVQEAIVDAEKNAHINGVTQGTHFFAGKAEQLVRHHPHLMTLLENLELIVVDPPREGLHPSVVEFLLEMHKTKKPKLLYISCNPVTFARDIDLLTVGGWELRSLQPVDMFPQTYHVEMIGILN